MFDTNRPGHPITLELAADALECAFSLRVDFYHQLLASFMADMLSLRKSLRLSASLDDALVNHGAMGQLTPLLEQGKLITSTQRLYEYWQSTFSGLEEKPMSYLSMAKHLPLPDPGRTRVGSDSDQQDIEIVADDSRLSILKQWRRGVVPEAEHLTKFLQSLSGEAHGVFLPLIMTRLATAWTKWIEQERAHLGELVKTAPDLADHVETEWVVEKFSQYPKYWQYTMAQAK